MVWCVLTVLTLYLVQILLGPAIWFLSGGTGDKARYAMGPRDQAVDKGVRVERAQRASRNMQENLLLFLPLALLAVATGSGEHPAVLASGWVFVAARAVYVPAYVLHWGPVRSLVWSVAFLAVLALAVAVATLGA